MYTIVYNLYTIYKNMLDFLKNGCGEILKIFFNDPEKEYYLREIARILKKEPGHYQRYFKEFVASGILQDERRGNMRFFKLNKNHPLYQELKSMVSKTVGLEYKLKDLIISLNVSRACIFGSTASGRENSASDVDLLIIGDVDQDALISKISALEKEVGREINYHIYTESELIKKIKSGDSFFINIFTSPLLALKGNFYEFVELAKRQN